MQGRPLPKTAALLGAVAMCAFYTSSAAGRTWIRADMKDQVKGCSVSVYEDPGFRGARWTTTNGWAAVGWEFSDKISSIKVRSGIWRFFKNDNFDEQIETLYPGSYPKLKPTVANSFTSFRCIRAT